MNMERERINEYLRAAPVGSQFTLYELRRECNIDSGFWAEARSYVVTLIRQGYLEENGTTCRAENGYMNYDRPLILYRVVKNYPSKKNDFASKVIAALGVKTKALQEYTDDELIAELQRRAA